MKLILSVLVFLSMAFVGHAQTVEIEKGECNNKALADIMRRAMTSDSEQSKNAIADQAKKQIGGTFGVACSLDDLAYGISPTELFCKAWLGDLVCFAYKRG